MASSDNISASTPPRSGSESETEIAPQLESVLRNLNVNLDDELTRYRRQRHGRVPPPPPPRRAVQRQTIDLISVPASAPHDATVESNHQPPTLPPPPPNPFLNKVSGLNEDIDQPEEMDQASDMSELGLVDIGEPALDGEFEHVSPDLNDSALSLQSSHAETEGYLESSEELLKSIDDERVESSSVPEPYSPSRKNNGLLKLAGLVLVLLGGIGAGFAFTYPAQLQSLRERLWPAGEPELPEADANDSEAVAGKGEAEPEVTDESSTDAISSNASPEGYKPPGPDLSTQEFKELDDVNDLVTLDIDQATGTGTISVPSTLSNPAQSPLPAPTASTPLPAPSLGAENPSSTAASNQSAPATPSGASATEPPQVPAVTAAPTVAPNTSSTPDNPTPVVVTGSNYYIIASYTGDASLNKAREFVPDAFVRNFKAGARIQLAAFDNRSQAEDQVAFLTQQGITVELFGPTNE